MKTQNQVILEAIRKKIERNKEVELFITKIKKECKKC